MKKPGDWNQCRCSEGYQETEETIAAGKCLGCILDEERRKRAWVLACNLHGCPFCMKIGCYGDCPTVNAKQS